VDDLCNEVAGENNCVLVGGVDRGVHMVMHFDVFIGCVKERIQADISGVKVVVGELFAHHKNGKVDLE